MNPLRERVLKDIGDELTRIEAKWGAQRSLPRDTWIRILGEEFGEVCNAANEKDPDGYRAEMIQVAAVAIEAVQSFDFNEAGDV